MKCYYCKEEIAKGHALRMDWNWFDRDQKPNEIVPDSEMDKRPFCSIDCFENQLKKEHKFKKYRAKCIKRSKG